MQSLYITVILVILSTASAAALGQCSLGANKCDATSTLVMLCGIQGWNAIETCYQPGACHVGSAGNAYCDKKVECTPGESQCDAANYVSKFCNHKGIWETDRKCAKPGCCEVKDGKAVCKAACGVGQKPPGVISTLETALDFPAVGGYCPDVGDRHCDSTHDCILKCGSNKAFFRQQCCEHKKCYYDNASLQPFCA